MLILQGVLAAEDVERVARGLAEVPFREGKKTAGGDARRVKHNLQADGRDERVEALAGFVRKAIARHPVFAAYARPARFSRLMFNRYGAGQTYGMHVDEPMMGSDEETIRTDLSFTLFLTDPADYDGGGLVVDDLAGEREARPQAGDMALYPTGSLHRVEPVTRGERLACVGWVQSLIRRADQREILFDLSRTRAAMGPSEARLLLDKSIANLVRLWGEP